MFEGDRETDLAQYNSRSCPPTTVAPTTLTSTTPTLSTVQTTTQPSTTTTLSREADCDFTNSLCSYETNSQISFRYSWKRYVGADSAAMPQADRNGDPS